MGLSKIWKLGHSAKARVLPEGIYVRRGSELIATSGHSANALGTLSPRRKGSPGERSLRDKTPLLALKNE